METIAKTEDQVKKKTQPNNIMSPLFLGWVFFGWVFFETAVICSMHETCTWEYFALYDANMLRLDK